MKKFIRPLKFGAVALLVPFVAFAGHPMNGEEMAQRLTEELELSGDQASQVEAIFDDARAQHEAIQNNYTLAQRDQARQEMMAVRERVRQQLEAVLTPEQLARFEELRAQHRGRFHEGHKGRHHHDHEPESVAEDEDAI